MEPNDFATTVPFGHIFPVLNLFAHRHRGDRAPTAPFIGQDTWTMHLFQTIDRRNLTKC